MAIKPPQRFTIAFEIESSGEFTAKLNGIKGKSCHEVMKFLDDMGVVLIDAPTDEFFLKEEERLKVTVKL